MSENAPTRRDRRRRTVGALLSAALLAASGLLTAAAPASASGGDCYESSCTGRSPVGTNCVNDVATLEEYVNGSIDLKLLHSGLCDATWAKVTIDPSDSSVWDQFPGIYYVPQLAGTEQMYNGATVTDTNFSVATPMVDAMDSVKGCYSDISTGVDPAPEDFRQGGASGDCTTWH